MNAPHCITTATVIEILTSFPLTGKCGVMGVEESQTVAK